MANDNKEMMIVTAAVVVLILIAGVALLLYNSHGGYTSTTTLSSNSSISTSSPKIQVVAAENFWGSLMGQVCGIHCNVTSIVTDPNADPHEYEASSTDAKAVSNARIVIVNGVGYDDWALKLISASSNPNRTVLNVADLLGVVNGSNPHLWYNPNYVNATVKQMYLDLVSADPTNASYYKLQYDNVTSSLAQVDGRMAEIKQQFAGTKVAATEDIFVYLANATGLDLISPPTFMEAVAEGTDPSVQSVTQFENQLESGNVSVLVYNEQTVTPLTTQMKQIAAENNVTIVGVTETIQPPDTPFQVWMNAELIGIQNALNANTLGQ
jgi:zinc/manganese transport system substrate-binding protein